MDQKELDDVLIAQNVALADGFEDALIGYALRYGFDGAVAVYDQERCLRILMERDGMSYEDAVEFFEFNVIGAWVGPKTPIFASLVTRTGD